ncbi:PASTA domain-containing protein, partial [Streptococcus agalactiae]|nr:PASTA domain-containing protein [Streptococcus agalactiae]
SLCVVGINVFDYKILVSPTTIRVPDVSNKTVAQAKMTLENSGLKVGAIRNIESDSVSEGLVVKTDPAAGRSRREGAKVNLYIATPNKSFTLGNYKEHNYKDILKDLQGK